MLFIINSRMRAGVTREQVVEHCKQDIDKKAWELIKKGVIAHWFFKVGDQPGVIAILNSDSMEDSRTLVNNSPLVTKGLVEFEIDPVDHFPNFD